MEITFFTREAFDWNAVSAISNVALVLAAIFAGATALRDMRRADERHTSEMEELKAQQEGTREQTQLAAQTLLAQILPVVLVTGTRILNSGEEGGIVIGRDRVQPIIRNVGPGTALMVTVTGWILPALDWRIQPTEEGFKRSGVRVDCPIAGLAPSSEAEPQTGWVPADPFDEWPAGSVWFGWEAKSTDTAGRSHRQWGVMWINRPASPTDEPDVTHSFPSKAGTE